MKKSHIFLAATIFILISGICFANVWKYEQVANSRNFNNIGRNAIALDLAGKPHICYYNHGTSAPFYHCWQNGSEWNYESISELVSSGPVSISTTNNGDICFLRSNKFASGQAGAYTVEDIELGPAEYLTYSDMVIDSSGKVHAVCYGEDSPYWPLYYVTNKAGSWQVEQLCYSNEYKRKSGAIALDSSDRPHISALVPDGVNSYLEHHWYNGSSWLCEQIEQTYDDSDGTDIFIDSSDNIFIVFTNDYVTMTINYADNSTGTWRSEVITDSNEDYEYYSPRLTVDPCGVVHAVYKRKDLTMQDTTPRQLFHSYGQWNNWTTEQIADCNYITDISLAADTNGLMHLAFVEQDYSYDPALCKLYYASGISGSWQLNQIDTKADTDGFNWLELDSNDNPKLMYRDRVKDELLLCDRIGNDDWDLEVIPTSRLSVNGSTCRMDMDGNDAVHIAYQGWSNYDPYDYGLGYITNLTGNWVDDYNNTTCCHKPEIAVDPAGNAKLVRYKTPYDYVTTLFYTDPIPGAWNTQVLDLATDSNELCDEDYVWSNMECDDWGGYHIVYVFGGNNGSRDIRYDVKYGYSSGSGFTVETIEEDAGRHARPMLAVDGFGNLHIAWANSELGCFRYATNATGSWNVESIPAWGDSMQSYLDIATDSTGSPYAVISMDDHIQIASKIVGVWELEDATANFEFASNNDFIGGPSIQIDSNDKIHISFNCKINSESRIYYATNSVTAPVIYTEPDDIYFLAMEGGGCDKTVTIRNTGSGDLHVSSIDILGPDADKFSISFSPFTLPPGGMAIRNVTFSSATKGVYNAFLQVNSDDNQRPSINIPMTANCLGVPTGDLFTKHTFFDFNDVIIGQSSDSITVRIQNQGSVPMNIIYGIDNEENYKCTRLIPPLTLAVGESLYIDVWFEPNDLGRSDCVLNVSGSWGMLESSVEVAFTGVGVPVPVPGISIRADSNELEVILPGGQETVDIYIKNIGDANLTISDLQVSNSTEFTTDLKGGKNPLGTTLPVTLLPGESRSIVMAFNASILGEYTNELDITSNDPEQKHAITTFTGSAVPWNKCDFNLNKIIDFEDFAILAADWLAKPDINPYPGDVEPEEPDGVVNMLDLEYFVNQWLLKKDLF